MTQSLAEYPRTPEPESGKDAFPGTDSSLVNCKQPGVDPELFFDEERQEEAKRHCEGCWFRQRCYELGEGQEYGMWGGRWRSPDDEENVQRRILRLREEGVTQREIARTVGVRQQKVSEVLLAHGMPSFHRPNLESRIARDEEIDRLTREGLSQRAIGERIGVAERTVHRVLKGFRATGEQQLRKAG